jgi:hypothetical protein
MFDLASLIPSGLTPSLTMASMDRHLGWALTLTAVTLFVLQRAPQIVRFGIGAAVFLIALAPTKWSMSHWLGLAYQTPSLVTQGMALIYLLRVLLARGIGSRGQVSTDDNWPLSIFLVGSAVGWILVLDTFAIFPISLYAFGYSKEVAILGLSLASAFWLVSMRRSDPHGGRRARDLAIVLALAIAIHTFTRLPSGNAWDAMLDPWLWLVAQGALLVRGVRFAMAAYSHAPVSMTLHEHIPSTKR